MAKFDWEVIKNEYLANDITYQDLSTKHGVSYSTLEKRARRENWKSAKSAISEKVAKEVRKKVAKKVATQTAKKIDLVDDSISKLLKLINKTIDVVDMEDAADTRKLNDIANSLDKATKLQRLIKGTLTEFEKQKLDIERQRLDVERSRAKVPGIDDDEDETGVVLLPEVNHSLNTEEGVQDG